MNKSIASADFQKPQLTSQRRGRVWSITLKLRSDPNSIHLEGLRQQIHCAIQNNELLRMTALLPRFKEAFLEKYTTKELRVVSIADELRSDDGIDAILLASANKDPQMVELLIKHRLGLGNKDIDMLLHSLAFAGHR